MKPIPSLTCFHQQNIEISTFVQSFMKFSLKTSLVVQSCSNILAQNVATSSADSDNFSSLPTKRIPYLTLMYCYIIIYTLTTKMYSRQSVPSQQNRTLSGRGSQSGANSGPLCSRKFHLTPSSRRSSSHLKHIYPILLKQSLQTSYLSVPSYLYHFEVNRMSFYKLKFDKVTIFIPVFIMDRSTFEVSRILLC